MSRWYVEEECLVEDEGQPLPKLQAKVHVEAGERRSLAKELVRRRICRWIPESQVLRYRGEKVLNGLFGIEKDKRIPSGESVLRLRMNLPSNSIHKTS